MNKKEKLFLIATDILLLGLILYPIFLGGIVGGYDPGFHMGRIHTLATNIASGHFPNPIGYEYVNTFGYGVGFFYGNFFIYPFAILNALGLTAYKSYIIYIITFVILNIFSINYVTHKLFNNSWATILSAPLYLSSYYFIGVIYFRAAAGELIAFAIIPWVLLSVFKLTQGKTNYWIMFGISFSLLLVTHILSFLITAGAAILIFIMSLITIFKNRKIFWAFVKGTLLFLGLSSVFLFSFVEQYLTQSFVSTAVDKYGNYLLVLNAEWMPDHLFDTRQFLPMNGTFLVVLLIFSLLYYLYKGRGFHFSSNVIPKAFIVVILYSSLILSADLLMLAVKLFKPLILLQIITRVNVVILPLSVLLVANALGEMISNWGKFKMPATAALFAIIAAITVMFPIKTNLNFVAQRKGPISDISVSMGEYEPNAFMQYNNDNNFQVNPKFLEKHQNMQITTNNHFKAVVKITDNKQSRVIMLPRLYYKGYQTKISYNGKNITSNALHKNGLVAAKLPSNFKSGTVTVTYHLTTLNKLGWIISILTLAFLIWLLLKKYPLKKRSSATGIIKEAA